MKWNFEIRISKSEIKLGDRAAAWLSHGREGECESAERRRLRSSVAPPTEILQGQRRDVVEGRFPLTVTQLFEIRISDF